MRVSLFVGAGSSVELGVPAMYRMAEGFRRHVRQWEVEVDLVSQLMPEDADIEDLIERLDQVCGASEPLHSMGIDNSFADSARTVQAEVEWYVQHTCERIVPEQAALQWGSVLELAASHRLVLATTNYDRAVELAANAVGVKLIDGFAQFGQGEVAPWDGFGNTTQPFDGDGVFLLKLHGSTDWYEQVGAGTPVKLRHPMPLFANSSLQLPSIEDALCASLILPSREKRVTRPPFQRLTQVFLNAVDQADLAIFLGSSLRDPHIRQAALESAGVRPTFVVNPSRSADESLGSITQIVQTASQFLISTLPHALASPDAVDALQSQAQQALGDVGSVLPTLAVAMDGSQPASERCRSIEHLENAGVRLSNRLVETLIRDEDPTVARFGLGLIPLALEPRPLLDVAQSVDGGRGDPKYREELDLLALLMG